ncbi:MAG: hypothetical protein QM811_19955 [Pirellulales bacterium]
MTSASAFAAEKLVLVAGGGAGEDGGPALQAKLNAPFGVEFDRAGNLYFVEMYGHQLRVIEKNGIVRTLVGAAGKGFSNDMLSAEKAQLNGPHSLAIDADDRIYLADTWNNAIRLYDPSKKTLSTVVGNGEKQFVGDGGPAKDARFNEMYDAIFDKSREKLYLVDLQNRRIRVWDRKADRVTTVAGNGQKGVPQDGAVAVDAPLVDPRAVAVDAPGNIYILERGGNALRVVEHDTGKIRTVAGTGKKGPLTPDGPALQATLNGPKYLWCDAKNDVLIADSDNHCIRKYLAKTGELVLVAGTGKAGKAGLDGPPREAQLNQPHGVYEAPNGTLYISDSSNHRILKIVDDRHAE